MFISIFEQLSLNLGNFIFFILSANLAGPEQFGLFSVLLVGAQIVHAIATQWIFLPITSKKMSYGNKLVLRQVTKKIVILAVLAPLITWIYSRFLSSKPTDIIQYSMMYVLGMLMVLSDATRYYLIRLREVRSLLISNVTRWSISLVLLYFYVTKTENKYIAILFIFIVSLSISLTIQLFFIYLKKTNLSDSEQKYSLQSDNSLLHLGVANIFNTMAIVLLFNKVNIVAFGALQAFRSLVNLFPFIMQFLESHYSAMLLAKKENSILKKQWVYIYISLTFFIAIFLAVFGDLVIKFIYSNEYENFHLLLLVLFAIVSVQNFSRLLSIQLRISEEYTSFDYSAVVLWLFTAVLLVLSHNYLEILKYQDLLFIMLTTAVLQMFVYIVFWYKASKKE
jgi:O-antigen/teichoic acid export membrane protein